MQTESKIFDFLNNILSKIREKTSFLTENSYILSKIDDILFIFICLSIIGSTFLSNNQTAPLLLCVAVLYGLTLILKNGAVLKINRGTFFLLLYFLTAVLSTINSTMPHQSLTGLSKTVLYLLFFCAVMQYLRLHREKIKVLGILIGLCVSFEVVVAFLQNSFDVLSGATWQDTSRLNPELVLTRVYGTLKPLNPNLLGGYLIAASPFLWLITVLFYLEENRLKFLSGAILSFLTIPAIFMTGCRGAYLALFVMLFGLALTFYFICKKHYINIYVWINRKKKLILGLISCLIAGVMIFVPKISHRILSVFAMRNDSSTSFRMNVYHSSLQMFHDNFLMGIGCGNKVFREIYGLYMLSGFDALSAYSVYLETAVESGIFALIFYLLFLFFLFKNALKTFIESDNIKIRLIVALCLISVTGVAVHGFFDTIYFRPQVQLIFWSAVAGIFVYCDKTIVSDDFKL